MMLFGFVVVITVFAGAVATEGATGTSAKTQATTAPVVLLSAEEEAETFNLPGGFRAEVVACEPLVEHPVAMAFDADGRLFVAEMRGYMPDTEGWREEMPSGRVSILFDDDGDGRMDRSTVFLDKLVLPRAVGFAGDGVLIGTPPRLLWCHDRDGDGRADETKVIAEDFGVVENPENSANGLLWNLDNWIYNANYTRRIRFRDGSFEFEPLADLGQYGITRDDWGRLFFNTNSDYLRAALVPPHYSMRNPRSPMSLANERIGKDQTIWPAHAATVNRGYREGFLRPDGTLMAFTAACSPLIFRSMLFGEEFYGNVFACEATSNLVRRSIITESGVMLSAKAAYQGREFIASTYERFRPVSLNVGPEGALYVVDMHHGLIQHKMSITQYAKENYKAKQLHKHLRTGRIFRIVPETVVKTQAAVARPRLSQASSEILVRQLTHDNGWWRDTAQRLLVERKDEAAVKPLQELARNGADPVHRATALWTLDGMGTLADWVVKAALADSDSRVRANAARLCEGRKSLLEELYGGATQTENVRLQWMLTLAHEKQDETVLWLLRDAGDDYKLREAAVSGLAGREIPFLRRLLNHLSWREGDEARGNVITDIARSITRRDDPLEVLGLVELIGHVPTERQWQRIALLDAIPAARKDAFGAAQTIHVTTKPAVIDYLASSSNKSIRTGAEKVAALFDWPGKPAPPRPPVVPLNAKQQALFEIGREQFTKVCAQCHQPSGMGQEGKAPPLVNSPWLNGPPSRLIRIVLHGLRGPVEVEGKVWNLEMPALGAMTDEQIAGVLTYLRRSWGHTATAIEPDVVANIRDWTQAKKDGWMVRELMEMK